MRKVGDSLVPARNPQFDAFQLKSNLQSETIANAKSPLDFHSDVGLDPGSHPNVRRLVALRVSYAYLPTTLLRRLRGVLH